MRRILFVDDEPNILAGLKRMLMRQRKEWDMHFAESGAEALAVLDAGEPFDVVISDMKMPGMQGYELLEKVAEKWPGMSRLILSGHAEQESALRSAGVAHQFISKPCDPDILKQAVMRTCALRERLANDAIADALTGLDSLPVLPEAYRRINHELSTAEPSMARIASILADDIAMSTKILQLVNSSYFGLPRQIESIEQAAMLLGLNTVRDLVLSTAVFRAFGSAADANDAQALWRYGRDAATLVGQMCASLELDQATTGELKVAAFIQDVGRLALASIRPSRRAEVEAFLRQNPDRLAAEIAVYGAQHAAVGAYILGLWGLPDRITEAVFYHHDPTPPAGETGDTAGLVAVANEIMRVRRDRDPTAREQLDTLLAGTPSAPFLDEWIGRVSGRASTEESTAA